MMVTISNHQGVNSFQLPNSLSPNSTITTSASNPDFFWRSLPGRVSPSIIYNNSGWNNESGGSGKRQHLSPPMMHEDADVDSNGSGTMSSSSSSGDEQPRKTSLVSRQLARIRSSMRLRRNTTSATDSMTSSSKLPKVTTPEEAEDDRLPLVPSTTTTLLRPLNDTTTTVAACHNKYHQKKRYRSQSTPTLCCCSSGPNRRCSQPLMRTPAIKNHFQALARVFKRSVVRNKSKSTSLATNDKPQDSLTIASPRTSHPGTEDRTECAKYLRSLTNNNELRPRLNTVLRDQRAHEAFRIFLKGEYSDENINFWSDVEHYKTLEDVEKRDQIANTIFSTYLKTDASCEINISHETKAKIVQLIEAYDHIHNSTAFNQAQNEIFYLMESDSFKRFLSSKMGSSTNAPCGG